MLGLYQQIVQQGGIAADDSPEQVDLRLTGLVVKRDGMLRVYNQVYERVFDRDWLERSLSALRPYGVTIAAWLDSGMQDESRLLRGQAYQDALAWSQGKRLGDADYRFLGASQELENRDIQKKLAAEEEAKQVLTAANHKANQRIRFGTVALGVMLTGAIAAGFAAWQSTNKVTDAYLRLAAADVSLKTATSKELFLSDKPFDALLEALRAARQLKQVDRSVRKDDIQMSVAAALQQAVYGVREQNTLAHNADVSAVSFSPDGQTIASGSDDQTVKLWNRDGTLIITLKGHSNVVRSVSFSPDGQTIASGSDDKMVKLWNLNPDSLVGLGCSWVHDYLRTNPNVSESDRAMCGITRKQ